MGTIDIIILCCFLPALFFGLKNGLVKQIVALCVIYFGITLSIKFSGQLAPVVAGWFKDMSEFWTKAVAFIAIFLAVSIIITILGKLLEKLFDITLMGWLNRLLGLVAAICVCAVILSIIAYFINSANELWHFIPQDKLADSKFFQPLIDLAEAIFPRFGEHFTN